MHNIGRTVGEANYEYEGAHEYENPNEFESHEYEAHEFEDEFLNELNETSHEAHEYEGHEFEGSHEYEGGHEFEGHEFEGGHELESHEFEGHEFESHETSHEAMEMEMATELLGVNNEAELEEFLGKLVRRAAGAVKSFAKSSAGRAIGGFLKAAAKKALPIVGKAAGTFFGGPLGGMVGGKLGAMATNLFELELEGLSNEDKEFEYARAFVRFANDAVRRAAYNPNFRFQPRRIARNATIASARRFAPGLLRKLPVKRRGGFYPQVSPSYAGSNGYAPGSEQGGSGSWYRQGNKIILNL
ncbi:MAG: hypothetical protein JO072_13195 [Parafilimonas sp.]|nr:hypothetical protein [Parafilimonas sp.]